MADGYSRVASSERGVSRLRNAHQVSRKVIINKKFFDNPNLWPESPNFTMYNHNTQYTGQGYTNSYTQYPTGYNTGYGGYEGYGQSQYMNPNPQPVPPGEEYPQNNWAPVSGYHANNASSSQPAFDQKPDEEAVAQERKQQNAQLIKQREDYVRKARVLRRELDLLRNQKHEIMAENSSQRDMEPILKENIKLQEEIQTKLKAIHNVIEMLSSIIKDGSKISDLEAQLDESPKTHHKNNNHKSHHSENSDHSVKYNYMHYDPELHWCRMCDEFPKTAKDFLLHLQSDKHKNNIQENDVGDNTPWHKLPPETELPTYEGAPKKRIPIRGLQFFISAPAWYCKLCDTWIGDLHCASHHLKSQAHFQNYANFVEQNSHWEIEWLKDREKAMARNELNNSSDSESDKKKKKHKKRSTAESGSKDKKKKKRSKKRRKHSSDTSSSSSSSDSSSEEEDNGDKTKSIRVVMRNMKVQSIMNEDLSGKWEMLERLVGEHKKKEEMQRVKEKEKLKEPTEDKLINQWMTVSEPQDKEKVLLDNLKDRMKHKQEIERAKYAEMERRQREKEREERELKEREQREEQENRERLERERREREREEYERIRDKERNQVRFKTRDRENYRKRRTPSPPPSPDRRPSPPKEERHYRQDPRRSSRENGRESSHSRRSRSTSQERKENSDKKKPPGPPSKRLPFIGRMPLFKNKKMEERVEKEIKKEDYDIPRVTRFQPGNLARAFLPSPDVVCFPKLSSFPPLAPPPPPIVTQPDPPEPPKISEEPPKAPPAPKIGVSDETSQEDNVKEDTIQDDSIFDPSQMMDPMMNQYYSGMDYNMMYQQMYDYSQCQEEVVPQPPPPPDDVPLAHTMPLQPPPLPPNDPNDEDDLALLGMSADDMAAQSF